MNAENREQDDQPAFGKKAFICPICQAYAEMTWNQYNSYFHDFDNKSGYIAGYHFAVCMHCRTPSIWKTYHVKQGNQAESSTMIYPIIEFDAPEPSADMPSEILKDYDEAARIHHISKRGSAALLRLALQKLLKHLGEKGENINEDIRALEKKNILAPEVIDIADAVRLIGNNAVHPGKLSDTDFDDVASSLFKLINYIVKTAITDPKERKRILSKLPVKPKTP